MTNTTNNCNRNNTTSLKNPNQERNYQVSEEKGVWREKNLQNILDKKYSTTKI